MSKNVRVPYGESQSDTATLLLAAAEESDDFEVGVVRTDSYGGFIVPEEIAKSAGVDYEDEGAAQGHIYSDEEMDEAREAALQTPGEMPADNSQQGRDPDADNSAGQPAGAPEDEPHNTEVTTPDPDAVTADDSQQGRDPEADNDAAVETDEVAREKVVSESEPGTPTADETDKPVRERAAKKAAAKKAAAKKSGGK